MASADGSAQDVDNGSPRAMRTLCEPIKEAIGGVSRPGRARRRLPRDRQRCGTVERWGNGCPPLPRGGGIKNDERRQDLQLFFADVTGVFTSDPKSDGNAELMSIERNYNGDDDGTRGRSEAD